MKILNLIVLMFFLGTSVFAQSIDFRAIENKLSAYDSESSAVVVSSALFSELDAVQLAKDLGTLKTSDKLKAIASKLSAKVKKGNFVSLSEVEIASQDGVQLAGPLFLNSTNIIAVLGWMFLKLRADYEAASKNVKIGS